MRKLGRPSGQRKAMLKSLTTDLILREKITTTVEKSKEVQKIVESIIALAIKEKDNFEVVEQKIVKAKLDADGRKVTEKAVSKNGKEYNKVVKEEIKVKREKDSPSRLHARREMMKKINKVEGVDLTDKLFHEIAPRLEKRNGGYTRITKIGARRGDSAEMAIIEIL